ncbi:MAG: ABC transporter ATP-binding protein [Candidatus Aureabacteria bacterium]|nr:ABC transporter ATP-binding protein [Candidatus Auribacterota bacterium]
MPTDLLAMRGIRKCFFGAPVNNDVTLTLRGGEILALLGENGAGKSTLMKILYGLYRPDAGSIFVRGAPAGIRSPADAIRSRIGMVHQHFTLVPNLTVAENIILGLKQKGGIFLDIRAAQQHVRAVSERYHLEVDPAEKVWNLSVGERQRVEILKTLCRGAEILILDEPTAVLTPQESEQLFSAVRALKAGGKGIIFISHKLEEVMAIADRVVVLRSGAVVLERRTSDTNVQELAAAMVGHRIDCRAPLRKRPIGSTILEARGLWVKSDLGIDAVRGISLAVHEGEIFGLAGVSGNGQRELAEVLSGTRGIAAGEVLFDNERVSGKAPRELFERGYGRIPEDRMESGAILDFPIKDNLVLESYYRLPFARHGILVPEKIEAHARDILRNYSIKARGPDAETRTLSGGNLQKAMLARALDSGPRFVLASQPTRGLDVGAACSIRSRLFDARDTGAAIFLISEDLDEILALSDTIGVMHRGEILDTMARAEAGAVRIGLLMAGVREGRA